MDLEFIAKELIEKYSKPLTRSITPPSTPQFTPLNAVVNDSEPKEKISLQDYLKRKKELDTLINNSVSCEDADDECDSVTSSDTDDEIVMEDGEMAGQQDSDGEIGKIGTVLKSKNEVDVLPPVPPPPVTEVSEAYKMYLVGYIFSVVNDVVLVQSEEISGEIPALDSGSLLVFKDRKVLGEIFDTFGQVNKPIYSVRFNSSEEIDTERAVKGDPIYRVDEFSKIVQPDELMAMKGTDASNLYDEEIPAEEQEFSDDEKEQEFKSKKKNKGKKKSTGGHMEYNAVTAEYPDYQQQQPYLQNYPMMGNVPYTVPPQQHQGFGYPNNFLMMQQQPQFYGQLPQYYPFNPNRYGQPYQMAYPPLNPDMMDSQLNEQIEKLKESNPNNN